MVDVGRLPADGARVVLLAAMVVILPAAGLVLLISLLGLAGAYENTETSEWQFVLIGVGAAVGLVATVVAIRGLATRSRTVTAGAALAQGAAALFLLVLWTLLGGGDDFAITGFGVVIVIDVVMGFAARRVPAAQGAGDATVTVNPALEREATAAVNPALGRPMAESAQRRISLVGMVTIAAIGGLAPLIEQAMGGPFNLRLAGGAGLLALPAVVAIGPLRARSRQVAAGAAIVQGVTAALLLFLWDQPQWHEIGAYDREDTAFNVYLAGVMAVDVVTLWATRLPAPILRPT